MTSLPAGPAPGSPLSRGQWLRMSRQSRGWSVPEMRRHLREAARESGDTLPANECLGVMIRRWEKDDGGVSERYRLHYCRAFGIPFEAFGTAPTAPPPVAGTARPAQPGAPAGGPRPAGAPAAPPPAPSAAAPAPPAGPGDLGEPQGEAGGGAPVAGQVLLAARQGGEHARRAERRDIGEASLEHLRCEVIRLSREYMTGEPLPLFFEMAAIRQQVHAALEGRLWPRDETELYFLLGTLASLMADAARDAGSPAAAEELGRAGLAYALAISHQPLTGQLRLSLAAAAWWAGQPRRCLDLARTGLDYLPAGPKGAHLHLIAARAAARLGDAGTAMAQITAAGHAWNLVPDMDPGQDLLEIGGQLGVSRACRHYLTGSALTELPAAGTDALTQLSEAVDLYTQGPGPGEDHSEHCKNLARTDLATALLAAGQLDAAVVAASPILTLPPARRISRLPACLARLRTQLAAPRYRAAPEAKELDELIERFCRDTITTRLSQAAPAC